MKKVPATWKDDCQGKKDYDAALVRLSTRYWPRGGGYSAIIDGKWEHNEDRPTIKPSARSAILFNLPGDYVEVVAKEFEGESFDEIKEQVEQWAEEQYVRIWSAVYLALQPKSAEALKLTNLETTEELLSHLKKASETYRKWKDTLQ